MTHIKTINEFAEYDFKLKNPVFNRNLFFVTVEGYDKNGNRVYAQQYRENKDIAVTFFAKAQKIKENKNLSDILSDYIFTQYFDTYKSAELCAETWNKEYEKNGTLFIMNH